ncbi:MAG: hypothetical protein M1834_009573 [Cirrosporium novae-zelandiae]|nr:MAG: hypothetical protein M1834_009573 [Cirrosporium novae-zelandiae]
MSQNIIHLDAWSRARDRYLEDLNDDEKKLYQNATLENIFYSASVAHTTNKTNSKTRDILDKLNPFVNTISQHEQFEEYFEKLVDMFVQIGDVLPRFREYERLFPAHERLVQSLSAVHLDILIFCIETKATFRKGRNVKIGLKGVWKLSVKKMEDFRKHRRTVDEEVRLAHMSEEARNQGLIRISLLQIEKEKKEHDRIWLISMLCSVDPEIKQRKYRSIIRQLLLRKDSIPKRIGRSINEAFQDGLRSPGLDQLINILHQVTNMYPLTYIVIDGIDECEREVLEEVLSTINKLSTSPKHVKIFVSGRECSQLSVGLQKYPQMKISEALLAPDVETYVQDIIRSRIRDGHLPAVTQNPSLEQEIISELVTKAHGMFLWVHFQVEDICDGIKSEADIKETLHNLPEGLSETYARIIIKVESLPSPD